MFGFVRSVVFGGQPMRIAAVIELSNEEKTRLEAFARGRSTPARLVLRARIVLRAAKGIQNKEIAKELKTQEKTVGLWRRRFADNRLAGIEKDAPGRGRRRQVEGDQVAEIVRITTQETPPNATHWSTRDMAKVTGVCATTVRRVWREHGLKPHLVRTFKLSRDPEFLAKLDDVVGLYLNPPVNAIVLSCDEKSQIQALDRTQPSLPFRSGRTATITHDYKRNGISTLFAALNTKTGQVISMCAPRHRHREWLRFLKLIDAQTPAHLDVHVIADNYSTHKHAAVRRWLARHPRFHMHFTPTSASWLNMVERFFRDITTKRIRRGAFHSVEALIVAIESYIAEHNLAPKPFIWTAKAKDILAKVARARADPGGQVRPNNAPSVARTTLGGPIGIDDIGG
jgi:transposase